MIETLLSFPMVVVLLSVVTMGIYFNLCFYLVDFWTQESALCLAKNQPKTLCLKEYKKKVKLLAFTDVHINSFNRSSQVVFVQVKASWPTKQFQTIRYRLTWPIQEF